MSTTKKPKTDKARWIQMDLSKGFGKDGLHTNPSKNRFNYTMPFNCVYFIKSTNMIKIGSTGLLYNRLQVFRASNPTIILAGLLIRENHALLEHELHVMFRDKNRKGEWFEESEGLYTYLTSHMNEKDTKIMAYYNEYLTSNRHKLIRHNNQIKYDLKKERVFLPSVETGIKLFVLKEDLVYLNSLKESEKEPWYTIISRVLQEHKALKEKIQLLEQEKVKQG
jgi:hypothetical protein